MSAKQISLKSPITIGVVMVLLVAVGYLNVSTFGGKRSGVFRGYRVQAHPPVPADAGRLAAFSETSAVLGDKMASAYTADGLERDPFQWGKSRPKSVPKPVVKRSRKTKVVRKKAKALQCSAIILGGIKPMAIIDGEGRYQGEKVRGMILASIDADGVTFRKADGSTMHLVVGVKEDDENSFRVVTRSRENEDTGRTRIVDQ